MKTKITQNEINSFTKTISKSVEDFKTEIKKDIQEIKEQEKSKSSLKIITPKQDFSFTNELIYLGGKDLEKEKQMANELGELMKKYKMVKCKAELFKNF